MPAFRRLGKQELQSIVGFCGFFKAERTRWYWPEIRRKQAVFFGKQPALSCHMVAGQGGFAGSDLSTYARLSRERSSAMQSQIPHRQMLVQNGGSDCA